MGSSGHGRWLCRHKVAVVEGDLADVGGHVPNLAVVLLVGPNNGLEKVHGRMADVPLQRIENVHFHLSEHACIVKAAAHVVQLVNLRNTVFFVPVLGSDQQSCTADQLVVLLVDDTLGAVPVEQVDGQKQRFPQQGECCMRLNQEVNEVRPHEPLYLSLHVNQVGVGESLVLQCINLVSIGSHDSEQKGQFQGDLGLTSIARACCMISSRYSSLASLDNSLAILICLSTFASHFLACTTFLALSAEKGFIL